MPENQGQPRASAVRDACVLFPGSLRDTLLRAAEAGRSRPGWSDEILDERSRNLVLSGKLSREKADCLVRDMENAFPEARVRDYQSLIDTLTCHTGDRQVLAAAITGSAPVVVPCTLRHFSAAALRPHGVVAQHPDRFLCKVLEDAPSALTRIIRDQAGDLLGPPAATGRVPATLVHHVPRFVQRIR